MGEVENTWDANGNLLDDGVNSYAYDSANRLVSVSGGSSSVDYSYRCNGLSRDQWGITGCQGDLVSETVNNVTTNYVLDQAEGLSQVMSDGTNAYVYGLDRIAQVNGSDAEYFLGDALGSVRQLTDGSGAVTLARSYDPFGNVGSSLGSATTSYGFTEELADQTGLVYMRARFYQPSEGRFLNRDTWSGNKFNPISYNRWGYVHQNPINYIDPSGHWEILPGYDLSEGGMYESGKLTMSGSPKMCSGTCWGAASTTMPIFVPQMFKNVLYNDVIYEMPKSYEYINPIMNKRSNSQSSSFDIRLVKDWYKYDILQRESLRCHIDELVIPENTDAWKTVFIRNRKSYAFSQGVFNDFTVTIALGMGMDDGFVPYDVSFDQSHDENWSIAQYLWTHQSEQERNNLNLVELWNNADISRGEFQGTVGGVIFLAQGLAGIRAFQSRNVTISVQEHKDMPGFYRAIVETFKIGSSIRTNKSFWVSSFVSYQNEAWHENPYVWGEFK